MLTKLVLQNFRCYENHTIELRPLTVAVGQNNAGKSTFVEALRLVSMVVNRYPNLDFHEAPIWLDGPMHLRGVSPSLERVELNLDTVFHRYGSPPASITAVFDTGSSVSVFLGPDSAIHAVITTPDGRVTLNKGQAIRNPLPKTYILPQVAPLTRNERILKQRYVTGAVSSALAPLHFRNQLYLFNDQFAVFKELAENSWPGLEIQDLVQRGDNLFLFVRDGDFVMEVGGMGHGLQMWLQAMWFIARTPPSSTVILDEPDVYLHADMQRKLFRQLQRRFRQVIVATHSIEILSEATPDQILVIDRRQKCSKFAPSLPAVRRLAESIGGAPNLQLTRLWNARRVLFVEGDDLSILKRFQAVLFPDSQEPFDSIPTFPMGGWTGWHHAETATILSKNAAGELIKVYCIFDRDYHTPDDIDNRYSEARKRGIQLHIWDRKEIENYLLLPGVFHRIMNEDARKGRTIPEIEEIVEEMERLAQKEKDPTIDRLAHEFYVLDKRSGITAANPKARKIIDEAWQTFEGRMSVVSGKLILQHLSGWSQRRCGVSISIPRIAQELTKDDLAQEVINVITAIERTSKMAD